MYDAPAFQVSYSSARQREILLSELKTHWDHIAYWTEKNPFVETGEDYVVRHGIPPEKVEQMKAEGTSIWLPQALTNIIEHPGVFKIYRKSSANEVWHNCYVTMLSIERTLKMNYII